MSHLLIELFKQEVDSVLVGRGFIPTPQQIKRCQELVCEGTRHHKRNEETQMRLKRNHVVSSRRTEGEIFRAPTCAEDTRKSARYKVDP